MAHPSKTNAAAICRVALTLVERNGPEGLTVRAVATALGLVPNALYHHFASRDALMAAVADEGARRLLTAIKRGTAACDAEEERPEVDPVQIIHVTAAAYLRFARVHPKLYDVVLTRHEALERDNHGPAAHDELWATLVAMMTPLTGAAAAPAAGVALWAFLHGAIALERANLLGGKKPADAARFGLSALLAGLRAEAPITFAAQRETKTDR